MTLLKWLTFLGVIGFMAWVLGNDAIDRTRSAEAMVWYQQSQHEEHKQHGNKEWQEFKECLQTGERLRNCAEQLD